MVLPVINSIDQIVQSLIEQIAVDGFIGLLKGAFSRGDTGGQVGIGGVVLSLLPQVLDGVRPGHVLVVGKGKYSPSGEAGI